MKHNNTRHMKNIMYNNRKCNMESDVKGNTECNRKVNRES